LKREYGCVDPGIIPWEVNGERFYRCPLKIIPGWIWDYVKAYPLYQNGMLPNGTGWLNESDRFLQAMTIIENESAKIANAKVKKGK